MAFIVTNKEKGMLNRDETRETNGSPHPRPLSPEYWGEGSFDFQSFVAVATFATCVDTDASRENANVTMLRG